MLCSIKQKKQNRNVLKCNIFYVRKELIEVLTNQNASFQQKVYLKTWKYLNSLVLNINQIIKVTSESLKRLQRSPAELIQRIQKIYFHLVEDMEKNVTFSFDTASDEEDDITFHIDVPISEAELTGWVNKDILWIFNEHVPRSVGFTSLQMGRCFFFDSIWASSNKHLKLKRNFDLNFHVNLSNVDHTRTGCHFTHSANFNIL